MALQLLLFDIDGTLLIAHGAGREAKARAMREVFGTDAGIATHPFGGKTDWQILNEVLLATGLTHAEIQAQLEAYEHIFARHMREIIDDYVIEALPGAHDLIAALRARDDITLGIVTGNTAMTAPIKLRAAGFDPAWFVAGAFGNESPDRNDLPALALQRANAITGHAITPENILIIGDTVADIACARAVGGRAVAVRTGFEVPEALVAAQPDYLLDDLTQFLSMVAL